MRKWCREATEIIVCHKRERRCLKLGRFDKSPLQFIDQSDELPHSFYELFDRERLVPGKVGALVFQNEAGSRCRGRRTLCSSSSSAEIVWPA